jgi:hypothetical protein
MIGIDDCIGQQSPDNSSRFKMCAGHAQADGVQPFGWYAGVLQRTAHAQRDGGLLALATAWLIDMVGGTRPTVS